MARKPAATQPRRFGPKVDFEITDEQAVEIRKYFAAILAIPAPVFEAGDIKWILRSAENRIYSAINAASNEVNREREMYARAHPVQWIDDETLLQQWQDMAGVNEYSDRVDNARRNGVDPNAGPAKRKLRAEIERRGIEI